jgi:hypothetical protein
MAFRGQLEVLLDRIERKIGERKGTSPRDLEKELNQKVRGRQTKCLLLARGRENQMQNGNSQTRDLRSNERVSDLANADSKVNPRSSPA